MDGMGYVAKYRDFCWIDHTLQNCTWTCRWVCFPATFIQFHWTFWGLYNIIQPILDLPLGIITDFLENYSWNLITWFKERTHPAIGRFWQANCERVHHLWCWHDSRFAGGMCRDGVLKSWFSLERVEVRQMFQVYIFFVIVYKKLPW